MDTGKRKDDYKFYQGFEGEKEVIISLPDIAYHIWDGYFKDIFGNPHTTDEGWIGFTRDYNEFINAFEDECIECAIDPEEYLRDLILYQGQSFSYNETTDLLNCLIMIMTTSKEKQMCVLVRVN
ncbi:MAG: hypothetical protein K6B28_11450 [Lachnospiraceae bacterium]|nr:hypothetical protein [Lachnospiraceae bacterium]